MMQRITTLGRLGTGLGFLALLWLLWPSSEAPTTPAPSDAQNGLEELELPPANLDQPDSDLSELARETLPGSGSRQVQVLDARTMEPVEGASVVRFEGSGSSLLRILNRRMTTHSNGRHPVLVEHTLEAQLKILMAADTAIPQRDGLITDEHGMVTMTSIQDSEYVRARLGLAEGKTKTSQTDTLTQVLIEPPILVMLEADEGTQATTKGVEAFLFADGRRKGPYRSSERVGAFFSLTSLWSELHTWIDGQSYENAGILIGPREAPRRLDVWLPIEDPVPSPVLLTGLPHEMKDAEGR